MACIRPFISLTRLAIEIMRVVSDAGLRGKADMFVCSVHRYDFHAFRPVPGRFRAFGSRIGVAQSRGFGLVDRSHFSMSRTSCGLIRRSATHSAVAF